jgi:hypothetical protein
MALPPGPGIKRQVREALESAPDGLTVPEAAERLGLPDSGRPRVRGALLDGMSEGWSERSGYRRGGRNAPSPVYRAVATEAGRCPDCGYVAGSRGCRIECGDRA